MGLADTAEKYTYVAPKTTTTATSGAGTNEFGSNQLWSAMFPYINDAISIANAQAADKTTTTGAPDYYSAIASSLGTFNEGAQDPMSLLAGLTGAGGSGGSSSRGAKNAAQILLQLRAKDPYAGLRQALAKNAAGARTTGSNAINALRAALAQRQNPYAGIQFNTPMAASNPLAAYMSQSGASTDQVDALRNLLQSWSADAAAADQQMASRLGTAWQNDQGSRLADASTAYAAFQQALAANLANQQGALDMQTAQYQADLTKQLADIAMSSGLSLKDLGVTL